MIYNICLAVDNDCEPIFCDQTKDKIFQALLIANTNIALKDITIKPSYISIEASLIKAKIERLTGRSEIIARFLYENKGIHSTFEIKELLGSTKPFKNKSILHSYLNNLISRGIIVKVSSGWYQSAV